MRRTQMLWLALVLTAMTAGPARGEVKTADIAIHSGEEEGKAFLAEPQARGRYPGIVMIQEWWGLNDWMKENARRLAGEGYVVVVPDLYHGKVTDDPRVAGQLAKGLPRDQALRDLRAAVDALVNRDNVHKDRIGVVGWCMGGGYALQLALHDPRVRACAMCYGSVVTDPEALKPLKASVLGVFGEEDKGIPPTAVHQFEEAMKKAGKEVAGIHLYKAGHGFMRPGNGASKNPAYREEAAKDAWKQVEAFFAQTLAGK